MANLLAHYEPASRPVFNASHIVTVSFGLTLTQISDMVRHSSRYLDGLHFHVPQYSCCSVCMTCFMNVVFFQSSYCFSLHLLIETMTEYCITKCYSLTYMMCLKVLQNKCFVCQILDLSLKDLYTVSRNAMVVHNEKQNSICGCICNTHLQKIHINYCNFQNRFDLF